MRAPLLVGCAAVAFGAAAAPTQVPVQTIELHSYNYQPRVIRLRAGQPVTLHFVNHAGKSHDFTAPRFFARSRVLGGLVRGGEVHLTGGQSASVTLVPVRGTYKVRCTRPFHKQLGMTGTIVVE